ncbi:MAG: hypothetical protein Q9164_006814 [Protoblastenia rupestris]
MKKDRGIGTLIEGSSNVEAQAKIEELTRSPLAKDKPQDLLNYVPEAFDVPQRIVLRFHVKFEREERAIIDTFFASYSLDHIENYYSHLCAPNDSSMMHIVLDLHCKTTPTVDLRAIEHKVFKVRKNDNLSVFLSFGDTQLISKSVISSNSTTVLVNKLADGLMSTGGALT